MCHNAPISHFDSRHHTTTPTTMSEDCMPGQGHQSDSLDGAKVVFVVPKTLVKAAKLVLEKHKSFDRFHGICPEPRDANLPPKEQRMRVHTTMPYLPLDHKNISARSREGELMAKILNGIPEDIEVSYRNPSKTDTAIVSVGHNPLKKAVREALEVLPDSSLDLIIEGSRHADIDSLVSVFPDSYSIYKPLLLLPANTLGALTILTHKYPSVLEQVWSHIARAFNCTHIALNHPIPPSNSSTSAHHQDSENILRSPVDLTPVCGDFGPYPTPRSLTSPIRNDFEETLWVTTRQNSIHQTWAPRYTMFSRGNVKEKARLLSLPSITSSVTPASKDSLGATAVDLYAGIGYFSFSYRRAGFKRVLCWELNPWSVEGLQRGAKLNHWTTRVFAAADVPGRDAEEGEWEAWREGVVRGEEDFWVFAMSNETADRILHCLRDYVPPIRHVNLGLLPVSRLSWPSAVRAVDRKLGGWVHAHENVGLVEMEERKVEVEAEFQRLANECAVDDWLVVGGANGEERKVRLEHVEKVKMYAPGVVHAVFDVCISGTQVVI